MSKVEMCMNIATNDPVGFVSALLDATIPHGRSDECGLIVEAIAQVDPNRFVKIVAKYLYESEVA